MSRPRKVIPFRTPSRIVGEIVRDAMMAMTEEQEAKLREDFKKIADQLMNSASAFMRGMAKEEDEMPASKPVQRTLEALRDEGWTANVAEKWIDLPGQSRCPACGKPKPRPGMPPGVRKDLHGFVDVDAFHPRRGRLYVQASDDVGGMTKHRDKLMAITAERGTPLGVLVSRAVRAGNIVEIHGWGLRGPRGGKKQWTRRRLRFFHACDDLFLEEMRSQTEGELVDLEWARRLDTLELSGEVMP